jgi:pyruvate formate lyase activating enzyme
MRSLKEHGIQTALDTCGLCSAIALEELLARVDILLYDLKLADSNLHRDWTGVGNERILANLKLATRHVEENYPALKLWIRTPLIPDATCTRENIMGIGSLLSHIAGDALERWELCAFNNLGRDKYPRLGMEWQFGDEPLLTRSQLDEALDWAQSSFTHPNRVFVTGSSRITNN